MSEAARQPVQQRAQITRDKLLAAAIDHRVGGKALDVSMLTSWGDVEAIMRLWANHGSYNLCRLQNRPSCTPPPKPQ